MDTKERRPAARRERRADGRDAHLLHVRHRGERGREVPRIGGRGAGLGTAGRSSSTGQVPPGLRRRPEAVEDLFAASTTATDNTQTPPKQTVTGIGVGWLMEQSFTRLIDPVDGVLTRENKTLDSKTADFQDRIKSLDKILAQKRERLERQFAQMETVLAGLQSQQQALGALRENLQVASSRNGN